MKCKDNAAHPLRKIWDSLLPIWGSLPVKAFMVPQVFNTTHQRGVFEGLYDLIDGDKCQMAFTRLHLIELSIHEYVARLENTPSDYACEQCFIMLR